MSARLICRSGELAGSRFELGADTVIGRDAAKRIVVVTSGDDVAARLARIVERGNDTILEALEQASVTLDGIAVTVPTRLDRMHVIGVEGLDFVFSRAPAAARPVDPPPSPAPPAPEPPQQAAEPDASPSEAPQTPTPDAGHTVVDMVGFGALPELGGDRMKQEKPPANTGHTPADAGHTVVDMAGFGVLPDLPKAPRRETDVPPPPADADATVQMPVLLFELEVNVPGHGPTTFTLKTGDNIIGRGSDCDIPIVDPEMWLSRKHANVCVSVDRIELIDLQGKNGTYIKGQRIDRAVVKPGSTFVLGPHLEFKLQQR